MRFVGLRFVAAALVAATAMVTVPIGIAHATQITLQVNNADDDYKESSSGSSVRSDTEHDLWTNSDIQSAMRFVAAIPEGATITSAILKVYSPSTGLSDSLSGVARGEAVGNAPAWTGVDWEITNAPKTSASVTISGLPTWTGNTHNQVADVTSIVQEIVGRCDWESGNALKIFLIASATSAGNHRRTYTYNSDPARGAKLIVNYNPPTITTCNGRTIEIATRDETLRSIDLGWTGIGHDQTAIARGATLSATLGSCAHTSPPCGACQLSGPVANICADVPQMTNQISNHRCSNDTRTKCTANADCGSGNTCDYYFGTYVHVRSAGAELCVTNKVAGTFTGAVDLDAGDVAIDLPLATSALLLTSGVVCPTCEDDVNANDGVRDGTCQGGPNAGQSCDAQGGGNPHFGASSLDCPPIAVTATANPLSLDTNVHTHTLSADSPDCTGVPAKKCLCSTCNNGAGQSCFHHSDCPDNPPGTAGICGGKRCTGGSNVGAVCTSNSQCPDAVCGVPGVPTRPHACATPGGVDGCTIPTGETEAVCETGPIEASCSTATFAACVNCGQYKTCSNDSVRVCDNNADCDSPGTCVADTCIQRHRPCFGPNGASNESFSSKGSHGTPVDDRWIGTLATDLVCAPASADGVNILLGLAGPVRYEIPVRFKVRR